MKQIVRIFIAILSLIGAWHLLLLSYDRFQRFYEEPEIVSVVGNAGVKHLACIMDGNRRWAREQSLLPWDGHSKGVRPVKEAVKFCLDHDIAVLSLYAFSLENFKRSQDELTHLFDVVEHGLTGKELEDLARYGVRIRFVGDRTKFPARLISTIEKIEQSTEAGEKLLVNILFCYGGRQEIFAACRSIAADVAARRIQIRDISPEVVENALWSGDCPIPDIVVRTGGEQRLSNCMPWQTTYSELIFLKKFWPAMERRDFESLLVEYQRRKRNFGK